jgi:tetratricopeptide (TPR) repeat protein
MEVIYFFEKVFTMNFLNKRILLNSVASLLLMQSFLAASPEPSSVDGEGSHRSLSKVGKSLIDVGEDFFEELINYVDLPTVYNLGQTSKDLTRIAYRKLRRDYPESFFKSSVKVLTNREETNSVSYADLRVVISNLVIDKILSIPTSKLRNSSSQDHIEGKNLLKFVPKGYEKDLLREILFNTSLDTRSSPRNEINRLSTSENPNAQNLYAVWRALDRERPIQEEDISSAVSVLRKVEKEKGSRISTKVFYVQGIKKLGERLKEEKKDELYVQLLEKSISMGYFNLCFLYSPRESLKQTSNASLADALNICKNTMTYRKLFRNNASFHEAQDYTDGINLEKRPGYPIALRWILKEELSFDSSALYLFQNREKKLTKEKQYLQLLEELLQDPNLEENDLELLRYEKANVHNKMWQDSQDPITKMTEMEKAYDTAKNNIQRYLETGSDNYLTYIWERQLNHYTDHLVKAYKEKAKTSQDPRDWKKVITIYESYIQLGKKISKVGEFCKDITIYRSSSSFLRDQILNAIVNLVDSYKEKAKASQDPEDWGKAITAQESYIQLRKETGQDITKAKTFLVSLTGSLADAYKEKAKASQDPKDWEKTITAQESYIQLRKKTGQDITKAKTFLVSLTGSLADAYKEKAKASEDPKD